ncbi:MAG: BACON domain-containing carbohydrate-binding protein, partial [Bacteroidota bacterium]
QQVEKIVTCGTTISSVYELLEDGGCAFKKADPNSDCRSYRDWANLKKVNGDKPVKVILDESFITGKPFKLAQSELSACDNIPNFKEIYSTDCQKVGAKPKASESLKGMIESVSCDKISGWAVNTKNLDEIQTIDIYIDSVKIGTTQANVGNRPDLVTIFSNSKANFRAFSFSLPDTAWYKSGQAKRIYARFANTNTLLEDSGDLKILACDGIGSGTCGAKYRLIISPDSLTNVLTRATEYKIAVSSNTKWQISKSVNWLTTSVDTGSFNSSFILKIAANGDTGTRRGRVILTAGNLTKNIMIAQKGVGQPYLTVSPDSITTITSVGAEYRVVVGSNVKITLSKDSKWITADEGEVGTSFGLRIEPNPDTSTRKGKLTLIGQGIKKVFYIVQKGKGQPCVGCNGTIDTDKPSTDPNDIAGQIAPTTYRGWVEDVTCCRIKGWAFDSQNFDDNLIVDIYLDRDKIGSAVANLGYRTDLAFNYQSDKLLYKAFCFPIPKSTLDSFKKDKSKQLYVRFGGTITKLFSPEQRTLVCNPGQVICPYGQNCEEVGYQDYLEVVYPNPSKDIFKLSLYSLKNQIATLKLVDTEGNLLRSVQYDVINGLNNLEIDAMGLKNGVLLLSISLENGNRLFKRLVKID